MLVLLCTQNGFCLSALNGFWLVLPNLCVYPIILIGIAQGDSLILILNKVSFTYFY